MPELEPNPLREGLDQERVPDPSCLVIFGASGDLTMRKLIPGLYSLAHDGLLPNGQAIIGFARTEYTDDEFRKQMKDACNKFARRRPVDEAIWVSFAKGLFYVTGTFDDEGAFDRLKKKAEECDKTRDTGGRRIYYLAVAPSFFSTVSEMLAKSGMVNDPESDAPYTRAIIEKPFGRDLPTARELNRVVVQTFRERQVFRIDHYLGKETVQNLLVLRFGNGIFEPFWNRQYIDHVQFTVAETVGVENRAGYFETSGITRDIIQNHMLQLVSLVAMEPPVEFEANAVRDEKVKVLKALREFPNACDDTIAVRGQYAEGSVLGEKSVAYRAEPGVNPQSNVETYAAMKLFVDNWRWADVPFYLRAGKRMPKRVTDISIHFRTAPYPLFHKLGVKTTPNVLAVRIQPDEGISLKFDSKIPGPSIKTAPVTMEFRYATSFGAEPPEAYERLLLETMLGDSTLFARRDEVETAWEWIDPLLQCWESDTKHGPDLYPAGSWGPEAADHLIERDNRRWRRP